MDTLFKQPATGTDLRFVVRCLWALDPNRHLFNGDFRDFARERVARILAPDSISRDIPEEALDDLEDVLESCPSSPATRRCWEGIGREMRQNLGSVHVMALQSPDYELWKFIRHGFGYGSGKYWSARAFPAELKKARGIAYNETLEALASSLRQHLDPGTVEGALILWALWCLELLWPEGSLPITAHRTP